MSKVLNWLSGKKTYITAAMIGICAGLQAAGIEIPEYAYAILGALGLGAVRSGIKK
jgi:hypothetical protein